ncbi:hypothetical protein RFI_01167 [Reticulomyxa filosa]|uniref:Uncharacterized protein n=1 Tax=Reticulomyxa filosa TaxID=46433 RepID=X6PBM6_RETFI|nr:hypothetical protein RFI_01167 [Reticulomyxa filosa]|eukprot:ETO35895.1 hypothetical protein RFI_01167 [Reticulomyxa filosa]
MLQHKEKCMYELENENSHYKHYATILKQNFEGLKSNNVQLLQLLQNVEGEFVTKVNHKPTALYNRNYSQEFDPNKFTIDKFIDSSSSSRAPLSPSTDKTHSNFDLNVPNRDRKEKLKERLNSVNKSINNLNVMFDDNASTYENPIDGDNARHCASVSSRNLSQNPNNKSIKKLTSL